MKKGQIKKKYEINQRYNNFVLIDKVPRKISKSGLIYINWLCRCDCGTEFITTAKQIGKGKKSCGCLSKSNRFKSLSPRHVIATVKYSHYVNSAKRRNLEFSLSKSEFSNLIFQNCTYCGTEPSLTVTSGKHTAFVNGIDRKDNGLGYTKENSVTCCRFCNQAKGTVSYETFIEWITCLCKFRKDRQSNTHQT